MLPITDEDGLVRRYPENDFVTNTLGFSENSSIDPAASEIILIGEIRREVIKGSLFQIFLCRMMMLSFGVARK